MRTWCHETLRSWGCLIAMRGTRDEKLSNVVINLLIRRETSSSQTVTQIYYAIIQSATCLAPCRVRKIGYIHASHITTEIFGIIWGMLIMLLSFTVNLFFFHRSYHYNDFSAAWEGFIYTALDVTIWWISFMFLNAISCEDVAMAMNGLNILY